MKIKRLKKSTKMSIKVGILSIGGFLIVQGALALFPTISGITSIIIGFTILTIAGIWQLKNDNKK